MNDPIRRRSPDGFDDDAIFADIVAHLNDEPNQSEEAAQPTAQDASTDLEVPDEATEETTPESSRLPPADETRGDLDPWFVSQPLEPATPDEPHDDPAPPLWRGHEVDEVEEHFEPPEAAPLPAGDLQFWAIIAGMGGGPLLLLYLVFFNREASSYWILTAIAMSVGGFALLVARMPGHHEDDDDGARL